MLCAIWYHLYNLKNVKNVHAILLNVILLHGRFPSFLNCANGTKSRNTVIVVSNIFQGAMIFDRVLSRSSRPCMLYKISAPKSLAKFTGKHLLHSFFFNIVTGIFITPV